ncbi:hypothetical protein D9757_001159 [Collybiopsis confluens]|uniref:Uncharacterized protein n=1 Tax=Collybiopsis confluens TaxID=2823264 RepID=A0A8H5I0S7_9AGAR|nr:hypothetical protein D9757_001159 [Collybiopsis confluens]
MSRSPSTSSASKRKRQDSPHSTPLRFHRPSLHIATSNHYAIDDRFVRAAEETKGSYEKLSIATFLSLLPEPPTNKSMPTPSVVHCKELE